MATHTPESRIPSLNRYTAVTSLRLLTPASLVRALGLAGVTWTPSSDPTAWFTNGLYTWVADAGRDPMESGCIYIGMSERNTKSGLSTRLAGEASWATPEYAHGHGMAVYRLNAHVVAGEATSSVADLHWLSEIDLVEDYRQSVLNLCQAPLKLREIESLAIRLSAHLGDTVAPLNSRHASAWAYFTDVDRMAWTIAYYLTTAAC